MADSPTRCMRCGRAFSMFAPDASRWNVGHVRGRRRGCLCPDCQTPEESAEAERNLEEIDYSSLESATDARVIDHAELVRINQKAVLADETALTDEALDQFDDDARHLLVLTPAMWEDRALAAVFLGGGGEEIHGAAWVAIDAVDWMGWEQAFMNEGIQQVVNEAAHAYITDAHEEED